VGATGLITVEVRSSWPLVFFSCSSLSWQYARKTNARTAATSYYDGTGQIRTPSAFAAPHQNGHASYYGSHGTYGAPPLYYPQALSQQRSEYIGHQAATAPSFGKRGFDDLDHFFGDAKRRQINAGSYPQVGRALLPLHGSFGLGVGAIDTGYVAAPAAAAVVSVGGGGGGAHASSAVSSNPMDQHYYLPPVPQLRSKHDLAAVDRVLEQMQTTVYENPDSPPSYDAPDISAFHLRDPAPGGARPTLISDHYAVSAAQAASPMTVASSIHTDSPARTPPSTTLSYTSRHSPSLSPSSRQGSLTGIGGSAAVSYPQLPASITAPSHPGSAPPQTLGSNFSPVERHLPGGNLGASSRGPRTGPQQRRVEEEDEQEADGATTPRAVSASSPAASDDSESSGEPEEYETWLMNVRIIEFLREYVQHRLRTGDYEDDEGAETAPSPMNVDEERITATTAEPPLYPALRMTVD